jgi:hypothetical protein
MVPYVMKYGLKQLFISGETGNGNAFVLGFVFGYLVGVEICGRIGMKAEKFMIFFVAAHGYEEKYVAVSGLETFELSFDKIDIKGFEGRI